ncbi:MAG: class I SAM-dependent methyltransferase, partial [Janthinobacterium lividum]
MPNNYDAAAWFYDGLSRLVFGNSLIKAQRFLVKNLPAEATILIVGGGTGWILEEIAAVKSASLTITYVEISAKMLRLSRQKKCGRNEVTFVNAGIEDYQNKQQFDVILTPFLFDNFSENRIQSVFQQLHQSLKPNGLWLLCDFQVEENYAGLWQKIVLQIMYWFFGWLCSVETRKLIVMDTFFQAENYKLLSEKTFYK